MKLFRGGLRWALITIVARHLTVARIAEASAVSWNCANDAVLAEGHRVLVADRTLLDGVTAVGVNEHAWRHTRFGDKYVAVIVDLTPIRCGIDPARLLDIVEGRFKDVLAGCLAGRTKNWCDAIEVVATSGFTGFRTPQHKSLPRRSPLWIPFHVDRLAGRAVDDVRRRRRQELRGHPAPTARAARTTRPTAPAGVSKTLGAWANSSSAGSRS